MNCDLCGHSLEGNSHGLDQNDFEWDNDGNMFHTGRCTYCRICNPRIFEKGGEEGQRSEH